MWRILRWLLVIPVGVIGVFGFMAVKYSGPVSEAELKDKFIMANPVDLGQIKGLSKYRSCAGHDYRGPTARGEKEATPRSMKHYIKVKEELRGKNGVIKAIAPFDGKISNIEKRDSERTPNNQQIWLMPSENEMSPRQWQFVFFHIDLRDGLGVGSKVAAGEVIGTAYMTRGGDGATDNFDMAVKFTRPMAAPAIDEPLAHMSDAVLAEYAQYGITPETVVISKEYRDQNQCPTTGESLGGDVYFPATSDPNDWAYIGRK